jgi:acetyl esterase/lipase
MIFRYIEAPSVSSLLFERLLRAAKVKETDPSTPPAFLRRDYSRHLVSPNPPDYLKLRLQVKSDIFEGRAVHRLAPRSGEDPRSPLVVYLHGGSYVLNATFPHWSFMASLVERTSCSVIAPDYPLAPEYCFADAYRMLIPLLREVRKEASGRKIILAGDSAGGGLALGCAMMLRDERLPSPDALLLLSPWLDVTLDNPDIAQIDPLDPFLNAVALRRAGLAWAGGANPRKPLVSPLYGNFSGLPPVHLFIGTKDILLADCRLMNERCRAAGTQISYYEFEWMVHVWMLLSFKEAKLASGQIAAIISSHMLPGA